VGITNASTVVHRIRVAATTANVIELNHSLRLEIFLLAGEAGLFGVQNLRFMEISNGRPGKLVLPSV
jgi:hypothetical protein